MDTFFSLKNVAPGCLSNVDRENEAYGSIWKEAEKEELLLNFWDEQGGSFQVNHQQPKISVA